MSLNHFVIRRVAFFISFFTSDLSIKDNGRVFGLASLRLTPTALAPADGESLLRLCSASHPKGENRSMSETSTLIGYSGRSIGREELALVPTPPATETHRPNSHHEIVRALIETLGFRHIGVVHDEYAVSPDGMKMFGVLDLATEMEGCRFSIGLRNSHDKSMRLAMTCGYRVFVCSNMAFSGDFTPVLAKHSKSIASQLAWTGCSATSNPCAGKWRCGREAN
jgi:hypothetical protein